MAIQALNVATLFLSLTKATCLTHHGLYAGYASMSAGFPGMLQCLARLN